MSNFLALAVGEITRMKKYQVLPATVFIALLWMGFLSLVDRTYVQTLFSLLIYVDVTTMAMLLVGVTLFFEKQEGTFRSFLVSPIHKSEYILAKGTSNLLSNLLTLVLLIGFAYWIKEVQIPFWEFLGAVILVGFFHTMLGFLISYYAKDFTNLIMYVMVYAFVFVIPVLLEQIGFITHDLLRNLLYALPTKSSMTLFQNAAEGNVETWELILSIGYLAMASIGGYLLALRKFDGFALKEGGQ
ncbi:ABC transporter permease [Melghirimyces algeriensis]|uniref:Fluoroquinolone transport system permease protein n=1 Tax=Melghirimyces algeriensis TaxID=910412 RepID=A0A521ABH9_9BACL|nr:ABC transporter permease [Melghirimyces algeriensis]SMO32136.1 fluoroquinolone transport system permease protein [Melghirimyces algeriensis]